MKRNNPLVFSPVRAAGIAAGFATLWVIAAVGQVPRTWGEVPAYTGDPWPDLTVQSNLLGPFAGKTVITVRKHVKTE